METITTYQVYREAYCSLLCRMEREAERHQRRTAEGKPVPITEARLKKLKAQIAELGEALFQMERGGGYEA